MQKNNPTSELRVPFLFFRKSSLIIISLLFISFDTFSQTTSKIRLNNLSIITNTTFIISNAKYDIINKGENSFNYSFESLIIDTVQKNNVKYYFNKNGNVEREISYSKELINGFYYKNNGELDKSYYLQSLSNLDEIEDSLSTNSNYLQNNFVTLANSADLSKLRKYEYKDGNLISCIEIERDGNKNTFNYKYDNKGRIQHILKNGELQNSFTYDQANNILTKEKPVVIIRSAGNCKYYEAEKYIYNDNLLVRVEKICKSDKKLNIKIPSQKINRSVPLTPTLANSVVYKSSKNVTISIIDNPNSQWQILETTFYENKINDLGNWTQRKLYSFKDKKKELILIEYQAFDSQERIDKIKLEQSRLSELKEREAEKEAVENERLNNEKRKQEELSNRKAEDVQITTNQLIEQHNKLINLYFNPNSSENYNSSPVGQISQIIKLNKTKKKKIIFDIYQEIYSANIYSNNIDSLNELELIQKNMSILFEAKTKKIETEIVNKQSISEKAEYLKNALNFIDK